MNVLLADGESAFALPVLRCLADVPDVRTTVVARAPWAPIRFSRHKQRFIFVEKMSDDDRIATIGRIAADERADVIIAAGQRMIRLLSHNSSAFSGAVRVAHMPETSAFDLASDKWLLARFLERHDIAHPATILYGVGADFDEALASLAFPVLIKPATGGSGYGIEQFDTPAALRAYFAARPAECAYVVQSYVRGKDIDCSVLAVDGEVVAHTIQREFLPSRRRFGPAAGVDFVHDAQTLELARALVRALRWSGIAHIDMRFDADDGRVKIIEVNPRYWGSLLGSLIAGVNFPHIACLAALDRPLPAVDFTEARYVAGREAMNRFVQRLFGGWSKVVEVGDKTCVGYVVGDPLPDVFSTLLKRRASV